MNSTLKLLLTVCALLCTYAVASQEKPLKVFILAGRSNMEGHAKIETFDYIGDDPATAPLLKNAALAEPVLIINTAWGGRSLHTEFRPPSAGPYELNDYQKSSTTARPATGCRRTWASGSARRSGRPDAFTAT